jgi:hypothetical protein
MFTIAVIVIAIALLPVAFEVLALVLMGLLYVLAPPLSIVLAPAWVRKEKGHQKKRKRMTKLLQRCFRMNGISGRKRGLQLSESYSPQAKGRTPAFTFTIPTYSRLQLGLQGNP